MPILTEAFHKIFILGDFREIAIYIY